MIGSTRTCQPIVHTATNAIRGVGLVVASLIVPFSICWGYQIMAKGVPTFAGQCVHERITRTAVQCVGLQVCQPTRTCLAVPFDGYRAGVRWNDDPLRLLDYGDTYPRFGAYMLGGAKIARRHPLAIGKTFNTMYRSHYGDLAFLHSMATYEGEPRSATLSNILQWSEFTYRVGTGDIVGSMALSAVSVPGFPEHFAGKHWTVWQLLSSRYSSHSLTSAAPDPERLKAIALGSLMHLIQDSFSMSHSKRAFAFEAGNGQTRPCFGPISDFYVYTMQDAQKHRKEDLMPSWAGTPIARGCDNPVEASTRILEFAAIKGGKPQPWSDVERYLRSGPFNLLSPDSPASAGSAFVRDVRPTSSRPQ